VPLSLRHLERFELGTCYPMVIDRIRGLLPSGALKNKRVAFLVDETGIGASVVDSLVRAGLSPIAVTIHGGCAVSRDEYGYRVPERDLVSAVQVFLQNGRLRIVGGLPAEDRPEDGARLLRALARSGPRRPRARRGDGLLVQAMVQRSHRRSKRRGDRDVGTAGDQAMKEKYTKGATQWQGKQSSR
jgi:hypothetical protein